ncbi:hypothetical protein V8C44DRAFT_329816 [Trichoderma aethiopicum]
MSCQWRENAPFLVLMSISLLHFPAKLKSDEFGGRVSEGTASRTHALPFTSCSRQIERRIEQTVDMPGETSQEFHDTEHLHGDNRKDNDRNIRTSNDAPRASHFNILSPSTLWYE